MTCNFSINLLSSTNCSRGGKGSKTSFLEIHEERRAGRGIKGAGTDVMGIYFVQHHGGIFGVVLPHLSFPPDRASSTRTAETLLLSLFASFNMSFGGYALVDFLKQGIVAGLQSHMQSVQSGPVDCRKLLQVCAEQGFWIWHRW